MISHGFRWSFGGTWFSHFPIWRYPAFWNTSLRSSVRISSGQKALKNFRWGEADRFFRMQKIKTSSWEFEICASSTLSFLLLARFNFAWHTQFREESSDTCHGVLFRSSFHFNAAFIFLPSPVHFECAVLTSKSQEWLLRALFIGSITEIHTTYTNGVSQSAPKQSDVQSKAHVLDFLNVSSIKNHESWKFNTLQSIQSQESSCCLLPYDDSMHESHHLFHLGPEKSPATKLSPPLGLEEFSTEATLEFSLTLGISVSTLASFK